MNRLSKSVWSAPLTSFNDSRGLQKSGVIFGSPCLERALLFLTGTRFETLNHKPETQVLNSASSCTLFRTTYSNMAYPTPVKTGADPPMQQSCGFLRRKGLFEGLGYGLSRTSRSSKRGTPKSFCV